MCRSLAECSIAGRGLFRIQSGEDEQGSVSWVPAASNLFAFERLVFTSETIILFSNNHMSVNRKSPYAEELQMQQFSLGGGLDMRLISEPVVSAHSIHLLTNTSYISIPYTRYRTS